MGRKLDSDGVRVQPTPKTPANTALRFNDVVFIKRELSADEQRACKEQVLTGAAFAIQLVDVTSKGYKVTLRFDDFTGGYAAYMQHTSAAHANYGYILTGRGSDVLKAFKQLLYKHYNLCPDQDWKTLAGPAKDWLDD